jgi:hypothetical protein
VKDSTEQLVLKTDTINAYFFELPSRTSQRKRGNTDPKVEIIEPLKPATLKRSLEILSNLDFSFPTPVSNYDLSMLNLSRQVDTIQVPLKFNFIQDSIRIRNYFVEYPFEPGEQYIFSADSAAITDIYGKQTEAIKHSFSVKTLDSYGTIFVHVTNPRAKWLLQILSRQEKPVRQAYIPKNGKIGFQYLTPGDYYLRIIVDENGNGEWDTGNLSEQIQPERIIYYQESVNVRANWEIVVEWMPDEFDMYDFIQRYRQKTGKRN